jgi:hypothetical protein
MTWSFKERVLNTKIESCCPEGPCVYQPIATILAMWRTSYSLHFDGWVLINSKADPSWTHPYPFPQRPLLGSDPQLGFEWPVLGGH